MNRCALIVPMLAAASLAQGQTAGTTGDARTTPATSDATPTKTTRVPVPPSTASEAKTLAPKTPAPPALSAPPTPPTPSAASTTPVTPGTMGGTATPVQPLVGDEWTVQVQPRFWYVAPGGKITLPSTGAAGNTMQLEDLQNDNPRISPYGELNVKADDWLFTFSGAGVAENAGATSATTFKLGDVSISPGDRFESHFDMSMFNLTAGYRLVNHPFDEDGANTLRVYAIGGVRLTDVDFRFSRVGGATSSHDQSAFEVMVGMKSEAQLAKSFSIDVEASVGGGPDAYSGDIAAGFSWRPVENLSLQVGYRILELNSSEGSGAGKFEYHGALAGLFGGVVIRF